MSGGREALAHPTVIEPIGDIDDPKHLARLVNRELVGVEIEIKSLRDDLKRERETRDQHMQLEREARERDRADFMRELAEMRRLLEGIDRRTAARREDGKTDRRKVDRRKEAQPR